MWLERSDKHHVAVRAIGKSFSHFSLEIRLPMSTQLSMQIAFDAKAARRATYGCIIRAQ
jgi:hypothetical protein